MLKFTQCPWSRSLCFFSLECKIYGCSRISLGFYSVFIRQGRKMERHPPTHARTYVRTHARTYVRTHPRTHVRTHPRTHVRTHPSTHVRTYAPIHARTYVRTHPRTHVRNHARTYVRTHARTCTVFDLQENLIQRRFHGVVVQTVLSEIGKEKKNNQTNRKQKLIVINDVNNYWEKIKHSCPCNWNTGTDSTKSITWWLILGAHLS